MRTPIQQIIERCRRQQQQIPGQLEIPGPDDDMTLADIAEDEMWREHTRERMRSWWRVGEQAVWATEDEALDEWRSRTA